MTVGRIALILTWMTGIMIIGLTPLVCQAFYRELTGINADCILPKCDTKEVSFECLYEFFKNGLGFIYLTISLTGSLFIDVIYGVIENKGSLDRRRRRFHVSFSVAVACFFSCLILGALNPVQTKDIVSQPIFLNVSIVFKLQLMIFIVSLLVTFVAKAEFAFFSKP